MIISVPALLLLAVALGGLKIELHAPARILPFVMANLFFVCMAEEALFRGYLQQRLSQWLGPAGADRRRPGVRRRAFGRRHADGDLRDAGRRDLRPGMDVERPPVGADSVPFRA